MLDQDPQSMGALGCYAMYGTPIAASMHPVFVGTGVEDVLDYPVIRGRRAVCGESLLRRSQGAQRPEAATKAATSKDRVVRST